MYVRRIVTYPALRDKSVSTAQLEKQHVYTPVRLIRKLLPITCMVLLSYGKF